VNDEAGAEAIARAWVLKDRAYAAWTSDPPETARAAAALHALWQDSPLPEIDALRHWVQAIADMVAGAMASAVEHLDAAAAAFAAIGQPLPAAQTRVPCIMALSMLGRHAEAVACAEDAQRRFVALGDRRSAAKTSVNLGSLHLRHEAHAEAARHYRDASVLFARIDDREHSIMADIGLGDALTALGEVDEAARIYARARMRAATHALPVLQAMVDESTALLDLTCGRLGPALAGFESARRGYEALGMTQQLVIAEKQLGDAYLEARLLHEAVAIHQSALARMQALDMADDVPWTLAQRGRGQALLGELAAARASFDAAAEGFAAQGIEAGLAAVDQARAELALVQDEPAAALDAALRAERGFAAAGLPPPRLRAAITAAEAALRSGLPAGQRFEALLAEARQMQFAWGEVRCLVGRAEAALAQHDEATARGAFEAAVERFEEQRAALPGDDVRMAFLTDHLRPYQAMQRLALADHARAPTPAHADAVLRWLDRTRARALGERLAHGASPRSQRPLSETALALRSRLNGLTRRLQQPLDSDESAATLEAARRETERALLESTRRDRLTQPAPALVAEPDDIAAALRRMLAADEAVLAYGLDGGRWFACVARCDGTTVRTALGTAGEVAQALQALRFQIETPRHGAAALTAHAGRLAARATAHLQRLHALLWAPLADALAGVRRVLVVTPAELAALPFHALHDGERWLDESLDVAVAPSAQWAAHALTLQLVPPRQALIVTEGSRLAHAAAEGAAVAAHFAHAATLPAGPGQVDALAATTSSADVLHLACHAEFRRDNPMFSALHLDDGPLTAERAETLSLPGGTVVLSACETGLAGGLGDEHVGLVRAFFIAGAARVVASLWPVDDAVTTEWMHEFYGALVGGTSPAGAVRAAQRALRRRHPHPYHWAPFVVYGGW
jgi:CHAT domain-containing protein